MNILAVIPARGGSKGIPLKNTAPLAGKPLLAWTVEAAQSCPEIDWVAVSTDHDGIATCARDHGAEVIERPAELAQDNTPTAPVLVHAYEWALAQGRQVDAVMTLQATSPLRTSHHMGEAIKLFAAHPEADSLVSVQEVPHQFGPESLMQVNDIWGTPVSGNVVLRRQEKIQYWARNGAAIYLTRPARLKEYVWGGRTLVYPMDKLSSIDIDDSADLLLAQSLLAQFPNYPDNFNT